MATRPAVIQITVVLRRTLRLFVIGISCEAHGIFPSSKRTETACSTSFGPVWHPIVAGVLDDPTRYEPGFRQGWPLRGDRRLAVVMSSRAGVGVPSQVGRKGPGAYGFGTPQANG